MLGKGALNSFSLHWGSIVDEVYKRYSEIILEHAEKQGKKVVVEAS
jgi:hypothetical protein